MIGDPTIAVSSGRVINFQGKFKLLFLEEVGGVVNHGPDKNIGIDYTYRAIEFGIYLEYDSD